MSDRRRWAWRSSLLGTKTRLRPGGSRARCVGDLRNLVVLFGHEKLTSDVAHAQIVVRTPVLPLPATLDSSRLATDTSLPALPPYPGEEDSRGKAAPLWYKTGIVAEISTEGTVWVDESDSRTLVK